MNKKQKTFLSTGPNGGTETIVLGENRDDLNFALKVWKRKVKISGKLQQVYDNRHYEKPSVKRKRQLDYAKYLNQFNK